MSVLKMKGLNFSSFVKAALFAFVILVLPQSIDAMGARASDKGNDAALRVELDELLEGLESGDLSGAEAKEELVELQMRFEIRNEERTRIEELFDDVESGDVCSDDAKIRLQEQLRTEERVQDKTLEQKKIKDTENEGQGQQEANSGGSGKKS